MMQTQILYFKKENFCAIQVSLESSMVVCENYSLNYFVNVFINYYSAITKSITRTFSLYKTPYRNKIFAVWNIFKNMSIRYHRLTEWRTAKFIPNFCAIRKCHTETVSHTQERINMKFKFRIFKKHNGRTGWNSLHPVAIQKINFHNQRLFMRVLRRFFFARNNHRADSNQQKNKLFHNIMGLDLWVQRYEKINN